MQIFIKFLGAQKSLEQMVKTVNGKTVYLAKITDKLVTKVNNLQSSLRTLDSTFLEWKTKIQAFATHENCHHNNYMEFLSKFSLEIARTFSTQLRFTEINDILHQAHKLHNKQLVSFADLPSFLYNTNFIHCPHYNIRSLHWRLVTQFCCNRLSIINTTWQNLWQSTFFSLFLN